MLFYAEAIHRSEACERDQCNFENIIKYHTKIKGRDVLHGTNCKEKIYKVNTITDGGQRCCMFLASLILVRRSRNLTPFVELEGSFLSSQKPIIGSYPRPVESISHPNSIFPRSILISFHLLLVFPSGFIT